MQSQAAGHLEVHVPELSHVASHHLVTVTEDDLAQVQGEQYIQEQDLVCPDETLLLRLQSIDWLVSKVSMRLCKTTGLDGTRAERSSCDRRWVLVRQY